MALPDRTTIRSVPGAAPSTYLTGALVSGYSPGQNFTVANTQNWYEVTFSGTLSSNPLGTSGPFTLVVDYASATEEKILCSGAITPGINTTITVWSDGVNNGRGYDGTPIFAHISGSSANYNVFPVRTAVEDLQVSQAVAIAILSGSVAGGDLTGFYPNPTLISTGTSGTYGTVSGVPVISTDVYGRVSNVTVTGIQISESQVTNLVSDLASKVPTTTIVTGTAGRITGGGTLASNITFDLATAGPGSGALGTSASQTPNITVDAYGRVISVSNQSIAIAESQVTNLTTDLAGKYPYTGGTVSGNVVVASGLNVSGSTTTNGFVNQSNETISGVLTVFGNTVLSGTNFSLYSSTVGGSTASSGQAMVYNGSQWQPGTVSSYNIAASGGTISGNLVVASGLTVSGSTVISGTSFSLYSNTVGGVAATSGQAMAWNGTQWVPSGINVTSVVASDTRTNQSGTINSITLATASANGFYFFDHYAKITTTGTSYSVLGPVSVTTTDPDTTVVTNYGPFTSNNTVTSGLINARIPIYVTSGTTISYSVGYTSSGSSMKYESYALLSAAQISPILPSVSSFNGRTGAITPSPGDYTAGQVNALSTISGGTVSGNLTIVSGLTISGSSILNNTTITGTLTLSGSTIATNGLGAMETSDYQTNMIMGVY
jgi:hypothetical protein